MGKNYESKKKSKYHHGNLKEELINLAIKIINQKGEKELTLKELATILNISSPAVYRHFSSKEDLVRQVINRGFDNYDRLLIEINEDESLSCFEKLYYFGRAYLNFAITKPNLFNLMFGFRFSLLRDINDREQAKGLYIVIDKLLEGQKNNILKKDDPLIQVSVLHSTLHGMAKLYINDYGYVKENLNSIYDTSFEIIMCGLSTNPSEVKEKIEEIKNKSN